MVECDLGDLRIADAAVEGPVSVMVRPEQIRVLGRAATAAAHRHRVRHHARPSSIAPISGPRRWSAWCSTASTCR